jgi:hypothetical protein
MLRFFRLALPSSVVLLTVMTSPLMASLITYNLTDVTFAARGTAVGTVTYDTALATVTASSITIADAYAFGVFDPMLLNNVEYYKNVGGTVFQLLLAGDLAIDTTTPLGANTITLDTLSSPSGALGAITGPDGTDKITGGTLVASSAVPEPATAPLLLLAATVLIVRKRANKKKGLESSCSIV